MSRRPGPLAPLLRPAVLVAILHAATAAAEDTGSEAGEPPPAIPARSLVGSVGPDLPLVRLRGDFLPESAATLPPAVTDALTEVPAAQVTIGELDAELNLPLRLAPGTALIVGSRYRLLLTDRQGGFGSLAGRTELHTLSMTLSLVHQLDERWRLLLQAGGGLSGDLVEVEREALRFTFGGVATYRLEPSLLLGAGVMTTYRFGELLPVPVVAVQWAPTPELELTALLPVELKLRWAPHERVELGLSGTVDGDAYALSGSRRARTWPCTAEGVDDPNTAFDEAQADPSRCFEQLAYSTVEVGPYVGIRLLAQLWFHIRVSAAVLRRYEFKNVDGEVADVGDFILDPNVVASVGLELRLPSAK